MSANKSNEDQAALEDVHAHADAIERFETHDLGDELEEMPEVHFDLHLPPRRALYPLDSELSAQLQDIARRRGISPEGLLNQWVQEKVSQASKPGDETAAEILIVGAAE